MKVLTAAQMREVDRRTIEDQGVPAAALMENAGAAVADYLERGFAATLHAPVLLLCGKGNNGGDGCVVARRLAQRGVAVRVGLLAEPEALRGDAAEQWRRLRAALPATSRLHVVTTEAAWSALRDEAASSALLVDAIFGTGLNAPPSGLPATVIRDCNRQFAARPRVAVDIPSGLPADGEFTPQIERWDWSAVLRATATVTFTAPKVGQVSGPGCDYVGRLRVAPIGTAPARLDDAAFTYQLTTAAQCRAFVAPRPPDSHKGRYGHVLVIGGSLGKAGAPAMTAAAALRTGAGLVTAAVPRAVLATVAGWRPELMTEPLAETAEGTVATAMLEPRYLAFLLGGKTVVALGPGISRQAETAEVVRQLIARLPVPWVLDADGLNAFAGHRSRLRAGAAGGVLTPHPGEMARLCELSIKEVQAHRLQLALRLAAETGAVVVLKGSRTIVADAAGRAWINPTGNPGMATGGAGDVLTGIVAGLLAQYSQADHLATVAAAVYAHGLAADLAVASLGEMSLCASDIIEHLPAALRRLADAPPETGALELDPTGPERIEPAAASEGKAPQ